MGLFEIARSSPWVHPYGFNTRPLSGPNPAPHFPRPTSPTPRRRWPCRNLTSKETILAAIEYIHLNPIRRGLVARAIDWNWSSARWYASDSKDRDPDLPTIHGPPWEVFA